MALHFTTHSTIVLGGELGTSTSVPASYRTTFVGSQQKRSRASKRPLEDDEIELRTDIFMRSTVVSHAGRARNGGGIGADMLRPERNGIRKTVETSIALEDVIEPVSSRNNT